MKRSAKHALVVKKRWLDKILDGEKDWEIRSSRTRHRGWVFFAQSKATGQLLGRARLVDCFELSADTFEAHAHRHCVAAWSSVTYKRAFAWVLEQAERFETPFAYAQRQVEKEVEKEYVAVEKEIKKEYVAVEEVFQEHPH